MRVKEIMKKFPGMLVCMLMFGAMMPVFGMPTENKNVMTANETVNVRSGPSTDNNIVGVLSIHENVVVNGNEGNWYLVNYNGENAYVYKDYLSQNPGSQGSFLMDAIEQVNVRTTPNTSGDILGTLDLGEAIEVKGQANADWYLVNYQNKTAYVSVLYLGEHNIDGAIMLASNDVNVRTGPSVGYDIIATLKPGEEIQSTGNSQGGWIEVKYQDRIAYVYEDYLKVVATKPIAATESLNVRALKSTNSEVLGVLRPGEEVKSTGRIGSWYEIEYYGQIAYVYADYVRELS